MKSNAISEPESRAPIALWITGLPGSGKSTITRALVEELRDRGIVVAVLESDVLRRILVARSAYTDEERDEFYRKLAELGAMLHGQGINVVFDATANLRRHREHARELIPDLMEVLVACSLETCMTRDPKGIYASASRHEAQNVPGAQAPYEPPDRPVIVLDTERDSPELSARRIVEVIESRG